MASFVFGKKELAPVILPSLLAISLTAITAFYYFLPGYQQGLLNKKKEMVRELTQVAWNILLSNEKKERSGKLSRKEAQNAAIGQLRDIRYGEENKDYYWISDQQPRLIMHPYRPDLVGDDLTDFTDPHGKRLFVEFANVVKTSDAGFVDYMWQWKDDPKKIVPKLSYVKGFAPWGWIIGTGIYLEDVEKEIATLSRNLFRLAIGILLVVAALSAFVVAQAVNAQKRRFLAEKKLLEYQIYLEQLVDERTLDLQEVNKCLQDEVKERKQAEKTITVQNEFLNTVIESLSYPFYVVNVSDHTIVMANSYTAHGDKWKNQTCHSLSHGRENPCGDDEHGCPMHEVVKTKKPVVLEHIHYDKDGRKRYFEVHGYPIFDDAGNVVQMIEFSIDINERKILEEKLKEISLSDELTGLYNRRGFLTLGRKQLLIASRRDCIHFLLYIDFDNMKWINDTLGHDIGDKALVATSNILRDTFRQSDIIGRIGGDEFVVLMEDESGVDCEQTLSKRLTNKLLQWNNSDNQQEFKLSVSIGIAKRSLEEDESIEDLLSRADRLMYEIKKGKKSFNDMS